jgi:thioredoxin-like negative regulator of GroEL
MGKRTMHLILLFVLIITLTPNVSAQRPQIVKEVRSAIAAGDFGRAQKSLDAYSTKDSGYLEAMSWMARGHLAAKRTNEAESYAGKTHAQVLDLLKTRADSSLPLA